MANNINILKPSVCFEVQKIIGISARDGSCKSYQVQWAPSWISGIHLVGCEDLIQQFEHEHTETEDNIKFEEIDASHSQDIAGLTDQKNDANIVHNVNMHNGPPKQAFKKDLQDNVTLTTNTSSFRSHMYHDNSDITLKVNSLDSIIQNIARNKTEHYTGRNTVHPDFQELKTNANICNLNMNESPQSNVGDNERQDEGDQSNSVEAIVAVSDSIDHGHSKSSQELQIVEYLSDCNEDEVMNSNSATHKYKRNAKINVKMLTKGGQFWRSYKNKKNPLEAKSKARGTFECNICSKIFSNEVDLKRHSRMHKAVHQCATCSKTFSSKANLQRHGFTHSTVKNELSSCDFCEDKFTDVAELQTHLYIHRTEKEDPLECPYCVKKFSSTANLRRHTRLHTGECPFKCEVCDQRFPRGDTLQHHILKHHADIKQEAQSF